MSYPGTVKIIQSLSLWIAVNKTILVPGLGLELIAIGMIEVLSLGLVVNRASTMIIYLSLWLTIYETVPVPGLIILGSLLAMMADPVSSGICDGCCFLTVSPPAYTASIPVNPQVSNELLLGDLEYNYSILVGQQKRLQRAIELTETELGAEAKVAEITADCVRVMNSGDLTKFAIWGDKFLRIAAASSFCADSDILEAHFEKAVGLAVTLSSGEIEVAGSENTTQDSIYAVEELRSAISKLVRIPQQTYGGASKSALASFDDKEAGYEETKVDINTILKELLERRSSDTLQQR